MTLADYVWVNPDLQQIWNAMGVITWLLCLAIGALFFIAFSGRFKQ